MATHSSILAWKIPWTEEPSGLQSMGVTKTPEHKELDTTEQLTVVKFIETKSKKVATRVKER